MSGNRFTDPGYAFAPREKRTVYIAGPMRGIDCFNFGAFDAAATRLCDAGWDVLSPAEHDRDEGFDETLNSLDGFDLQAAFRWDIEAILRSDAIYMLRGWEHSEGATLELHLARAIGLDVLHEAGAMHPGETTEEDIADEARRLVYGDRGEAYGPPTEDFTRTGRMWGAIIGVDAVPPEKVALCMVAVKISRECHQPKRDSRTDMIGYVLCAERIHTEPTTT